MLSLCLVDSTKCLQEILLHEVSELNAMNAARRSTDATYLDTSKHIEMGYSFVPPVPNSKQNHNRNLHFTRPDDTLDMTMSQIPYFVPFVSWILIPFTVYNSTRIVFMGRDDVLKWEIL